MPKRTESENPRTGNIEENPQCHIHDNVDDWEVSEIRENICAYGETPTEFEGKHYCLFHLPTKEKDAGKFEEKIKERLKAVEEKIAGAEKLPEAEQEEAKSQIYYDFSYVWFPIFVNFKRYKFLGSPLFANAVFAAGADFSEASFTTQVSFISAIFFVSASFNTATFAARTNFNSAIFFCHAYFEKTTFLGNAEFEKMILAADASFAEASFTGWTVFDSAIFSGTAIYRSATFADDANFGNAKFLHFAEFNDAKFSYFVGFKETIFLDFANFFGTKFLDTSNIYFINTRFCSVVRFYETVFDGYVEFEGEVFLDNEQVKKIKEELQYKYIKENHEAFLSLKKARLSKPDRVSFNSMKLRPCWFVNTEVRGLVFNDVEWQNLEIDVDRSGLDKEFNKLIEQDVQRPKESLIKACNQLADNAEANRRFEEAKQFRKQGIALRNYKCHIQDGVDSSNKDWIRERVCRNYPVVNKDGGNYYCLLHNPDKNKAEVFLQEFEKLREAGHSDFRAVNFPISLKLYGELPKELNFAHATFQRRVVFHESVINRLNFSQAYFNEDAELTFEYSVCKGEISFWKTVFEGKFFLNGFSEYEFFKNPDRALSLKDARFDNPQSVNFRSVRLRPHYFVGVDASKFVFHDCKWEDENGKDLDIKKEIALSSHKELAQAANQIAINYEENRSFEESTTFRYMAMQAKRFEYRLHGWFWTLNWLYWWSSGYGERRWRAAVNLVLVFVLFGLLYTTPLASFDYGDKGTQKSVETVERQIFCCASDGERFRSMNLGEGFVHSLSVGAFLRPEPKPADNLTKFFVFLESILAPLQAALLALAIRRKFMR